VLGPKAGLFYYGMEIAFGVRRHSVRFLRRLKVPASESQLALTLAVSLVFMAALLLCLLWQANVIAFQQEIIRSLWISKNAG
jgi:hypothetical protein